MFSVSGPPSMAAPTYNGDTSREQTESQGKIPKENPLLGYQVKSRSGRG